MSQTRQTSRLSFHNQAIYLLLLIPLAIFGFWKTYLGILNALPASVDTLVHIHASLMFSWLLILILQAWLVRTKRFTTHRFIGWLSVAMVPINVLMGFATLHHEFARTLEFARLDVIAFGMILAYSLCWTLGMVYRKNLQLHMRFMISTSFALGSAIIFRLLINWVPGFESVDASMAGNGLVHLIPLALLIFYDWRKGVRISPYWVVTCILGITHLGYWTFANTEGWLALCRWIGNLA